MRLSCLLLVLTLAPAPLGAQYDSTTVAGRAILRRFETIGQDPAVQALTESGIDLFGENSSMSSMDDSTMALLIGLMAAWMKGDERGTCRVFLSQREDGFNIRLAQVTDSVEAEQWADLFERFLWNQIHPVGTPEVTPPEEMQAWIAGMVQGLSAEDQARFSGSAEEKEAITCTFLRLAFTDLASKPAAVAAPMMRGLMAMGD